MEDKVTNAIHLLVRDNKDAKVRDRHELYRFSNPVLDRHELNGEVCGEYE